MNFQNIAPVPSSKELIDKAFKKAKAKAAKAKLATKDMIRLQLTLERTRMSSSREVILDELEKILTAFPNYLRLPEFYKELMSITISIDNFMKSISKISWTRYQVDKLYVSHNRQLGSARSVELQRKARKAFYGRSCSLLKDLEPFLTYLEECRRVLKEYPDIKQGYFTIAIAGFPNVGKSTILSKLTTAKPEIKAYPFTTKKLNMGYGKINSYEIQFIDTPGTLNRIEKMNLIEKQAYLAIRMSNAVVYIFDTTEPYPMGEQEALYQRINSINKSVLVHISKTDIVAEKSYSWLRAKHNASTSINELQNKILVLLKHNPGVHNIPYKV